MRCIPRFTHSMQENMWPFITNSCILPSRFLNAIGSEVIRRSQMVGAALSTVWPRRRDWQVDTVWEYQRKSAHYATVTLPVDWDAHQVYNKSVQVDVQIISISGWGSQWIELSISLRRAISFLRL